MYRQMQSILAAVILLFGLFAGAGQTAAFEHLQPVSCSEAALELGAVVAQIPGCGKGMLHQSCASDGVCSFLLLKNAISVLPPLEASLPYPVAFSGLYGSRTPPDTPPPIALS